MNNKKATEVIRVEYNSIGEPCKVRKTINISDTQTKRPVVPIKSTEEEKCAPESSSIDTRVQHTTSVLRELLLGKIARDDSGIPQPMAAVFKEYFTTSFGVTDVADRRMRDLFEATNTLKSHSSFLRVICRSIGDPDTTPLGPGQTAVYFCVWSWLIDQASNDEDKRDLSLGVSPSDIALAFREASAKHLSIPPSLATEVEEHLITYPSRGDNDSITIDDALESVVNLLQKCDDFSLEVDRRLFSSEALPHDILFTTNLRNAAKKSQDRQTRENSIITSLKYLKLLLDECVLHDEHRLGELSVQKMVDIIVIWQMVISSDAHGEDSKARLLAQCFLDDSETSVLYIELISFVHERVLEAMPIASIEDILESLCSFEWGVDGTTLNLITRYLDDAVLDKRCRIGRGLEERMTAIGVAASKAPKSYHQCDPISTDQPKRQLKTPLYITEQRM